MWTNKDISPAFFRALGLEPPKEGGAGNDNESEALKMLEVLGKMSVGGQGTGTREQGSWKQEYN